MLFAIQGDPSPLKHVTKKINLVRSELNTFFREHRTGVSLAEMPGGEAFQGACDIGLESIVSKKLTAPYKSGPCKNWIKVRNPNSPAYLRS